MFKRTLFIGFICGFILSPTIAFSAAALVHPGAAEERFTDDERVNHLPQRVRQHALDFYQKFNAACKAVPGVNAGAIDLVGEPHKSFVTHYAPVAGGAAVAAVATEPVNPLENRLVRFIDWIIAEDGIGTTQTPVIARGIKTHMVDLHIAGAVAVDAGHIDFFRASFMPTVEEASEGGNPIAQYLRGLLFYHGIGVVANQERGRHLLFLAARSHYGRAADFLHDIAYRGVKPDEVIRLRKMLDKKDPAETYLEDFIIRRGRPSPISDRRLDRLKEVLEVLPGNTGKLLGVYSNLARLLEERFLGLHTPTPTIAGIMGNLYTTVVYGVAASGYFWWGSQEESWWNSPENWINIGEGAALSLEALRSGSQLFGNLIRYSGCCRSLCCRRPLPEGISKRIVLDEARLTALAIVAQQAATISTMDEGTPIAEQYATRTLTLLDTHPLEADTSIVRHIVANIGDL
jgi:hypothetical protein